MNSHQPQLYFRRLFPSTRSRRNVSPPLKRFTSSRQVVRTFVASTGVRLIRMKLGHTISDSKAKYPEISDDILDELRAWSEERGISRIPDAQLALFAHSCYYDVEATKRCMKVYYKLRTTVPEFFQNRDPQSDYLQSSLKALEFVILPLPDDNGNRILFHRLADTRPSAYVFNDGVKLLNMSIDGNLYSAGCEPGYVFLFDMKGVRLGHLTRLSVTNIRRFFEYIQDGLPVRLKGIYVLNAVWFMDKVMALIRPFMNRELFNMLHLYTGDVSEIYEHIPPKCLPQDFGGDLDSAANLHEEHCKRLDELREYFQEEERLFRGWSRNDSGERKSSKSSNRDSPQKLSEVEGIKENGAVDVGTID